MSGSDLNLRGMALALMAKAGNIFPNQIGKLYLE